MSICETEIVTPERAKELREIARFNLQRPISESNVIRLTAEMRAGRFVEGTPIYFAVLPNKSLLALNGQHTLESIVRANVSVELTLIFKDVKDETEAAAIYSRLDLHKNRSWRDSFRAFGKETMLAESTKWTSSFASAIGLMFEKFRVARNDNETVLARIQAIRSRDLRLEVMTDAYAAADQYVKAVDQPGVDVKIFQRASVMAVGIEVMRRNAAEGAEFFRGLAADDGLRAGDPRRALLRYLREHGAAGSAAREAQARAVAIAWNAFHTNRKLDIVKPGAMGDFRIDGTEWIKKDFDPIREYLPGLFEQTDAEPTFLPAETPRTAKRKSASKRRIQTGIDAATNRPMGIFDKDETAEQGEATDKEKVPENADD